MKETKFVYVTRETRTNDLFPVKTSMEAAISMVMQRALIFDQSVQQINFDHDQVEILLHDDKFHEFVTYQIDRVVLHEGF